MKMDPVVHFEMAYKDAKRVANFYSQVFGWNMQVLDEKMGNYIVAHTSETGADNMVKTPGMINGGFYKTDDIKIGSTHVVIAVDDVKAAMEKVKTAGGTLTSEVMDIPGIGQYVSFTDCEGNSVGLLQPSPRA